MESTTRVGGHQGEAGEAAQPGMPSRPLALATRLGPRAAGWILPFALIVYLGLRGGGYDAVVRSEAGIAVWFTVLLLCVASLIPSARFSRSAWAGLALLAALGAWTALSLIWSESPERSFEEVARIATYLGVFILALALQGPGALRRTLSAVAVAIAVIGLFALLSRLAPTWFPTNEIAQIQPADKGRLSYPLNHWNAVAALMGIGLPLLLQAAARARHLVSQALSVACIPVISTVAFYTLSRSGWAVITVGLIAFLALHPRRLSLVPTLILGAIGSALCIGAAVQRDELQNGELSAAAFAQGDEMLAFVLIVGAGVGLLRVAVQLALRSGLMPSMPLIPHRTAIRVGAGVSAVALLAVTATLASGTLSDGWESFKRPESSGGQTQRLQSTSGNGRYQYWESTVDANATSPVLGIGAGTFAYWWSREGDIPGFTRYAHSLYMETFAELGIVGFLLVVAFITLVLVITARRALRAPPGERSLLAGAFGSLCAFAVAVGVDWSWQVPVIPVAFLIVAGAALAWPRETQAVRAAPRNGRRLSVAWILAAIALPCLLALGVFVASTGLVRDSQDAMGASDYESALAKARSAANLQPFSATPLVQQAFVLQEQGDYDGAAAVARSATEKESTNWRTWWVLAQTESQGNDATASQAAWERARALNPRSPLLASPEPDFG